MYTIPHRLPETLLHVYRLLDEDEPCNNNNILKVLPILSSVLKITLSITCATSFPGKYGRRKNTKLDKSIADNMCRMPNHARAILVAYYRKYYLALDDDDQKKKKKIPSLMTRKWIDVLHHQRLLLRIFSYVHSWAVERYERLKKREQMYDHPTWFSPLGISMSALNLCILKTHTTTTTISHASPFERIPDLRYTPVQELMACNWYIIDRTSRMTIEDAIQEEIVLLVRQECDVVETNRREQFLLNHHGDNDDKDADKEEEEEEEEEDVVMRTMTTTMMVTTVTTDFPTRVSTMKNWSHNTYTGTKRKPASATASAAAAAAGNTTDVEAIVQEIATDLVFDQDTDRRQFQTKRFTHNNNDGNETVALFPLHDIHLYFHIHGTGMPDGHRVHVLLIPPCFPRAKVSAEYKQVAASSLPTAGLLPLSNITTMKLPDLSFYYQTSYIFHHENGTTQSLVEYVSTIERLRLGLWQYLLLRQKLNLIDHPDYVRVYQSDFSLRVQHDHSLRFIDHRKVKKIIYLELGSKVQREEEDAAVSLDQHKRHLIPSFDRGQTLKLIGLFYIKWSLGLSTDLCEVFINKRTGGCTVNFIPTYRETALLDVKNLNALTHDKQKRQAFEHLYTQLHKPTYPVGANTIMYVQTLVHNQAL